LIVGSCGTAGCASNIASGLLAFLSILPVILASVFAVMLAVRRASWLADVAAIGLKLDRSQ
tara:strand:- start:211 stop:393 length:183 start_codon:yes stop_codon:yes gene_type:complete